MKYIKRLLFVLLILSSCSSRSDVKDHYQMKEPYKLLNLYSRKIEPKTEVKLYSYGYNIILPEKYEIKNGIASFSLGYFLFKNRNDSIPLGESRNLIVFIVENLLKEINSNLEIEPYLDEVPFSNERISLTIHFIDGNKIDLGQGVACVHLFDSKIVYEGYDIIEYRSKFPALGKHYVMHEESYEEALDIVKHEGNLTYLD